MKNIHILPTDQPSRLHKIGNQFGLTENPSNNSLNREHHIYITSDEKPKQNDWCLHDGVVYIMRNHMISRPSYNAKKVILTTDPTLIADGVQAIDDEFLEWFVKNSSCEFVEVNKKLVEFPLTFKMMYKIIIPQEEPKQEKEEEYFKHLEKDKKEFAKEWEEIRQEFGFDKKETLEEAAEKEFPLLNCAAPSAVEEENLQLLGHRRSFIKGANWQAEGMYSEEEVLELLNDCRGENPIDINKWFEQFKKK